MGTNEVTESQRDRGRSSLFDLPVEQKTSNGTVCSHFVKLFEFYVHAFCVKISSHGRECRSSERPKLALMQLITYGSRNATSNS